MSRPVEPPRLAERLLAACLRGSPAARAILGDLRQELAEKCASWSRVRAYLWYWTQAVGVAARYVGRSAGYPAHEMRAPGGRGERLADLVTSTFRGLRRSPSFAFGVMAILALGIGVNATMFAIVDRVLLSPPEHVKEADGLRRLYLTGLGQRSLNSPLAYSFPDYVSIADHPLLEAAALFRPPSNWTMGAGAAAQRVIVQQTTGSFFELLGVAPALGRLYGRDDDRVGAPLTAVVSHSYWRNELRGEMGVVGRSVPLGTGQYEIVGVAPPGFTGAELGPVDVWVPARASVAHENGAARLESRGAWWWRAIVRVRDGVADEELEAQLTAAHLAGVAAHVEGGGEQLPEIVGGMVRTGSVIAALGPHATTATDVSLWLGGVSLLVLLISCANAANLILARGLGLRRDRSVRLALGASRSRLVGEALADVLILSVGGTLAALLLAYWAGGTTYAMLLPDFAAPERVVDVRLVAFLSILALATTGVAGLLPALHARRSEPAEALRDGRRGNARGGDRMRWVLTTVQVALSVVLLAGAGLFVKSLSRATSTDLGLDADELAVVYLDALDGTDRATRNAIYWEALAEVQRQPEVRTAFLASETIPFFGWNEQWRLRASTVDSIPRVAAGGPYTYSGTEGFVEALGLRIAQGRSFEALEYREGGPPVVMVSASFARSVWTGRDPLGECVELQYGPVWDAGPEPCRAVVGVYEDLALMGLADAGLLSLAWPTPPNVSGINGIVLRIDGDMPAVLSTLRGRLQGLTGQIRLVRTGQMADRVADMLGPWRVGSALFVAFGALALLVASMGLYSVVSFHAVRRTREMGIRSALGAERADLVGMIVRDGMALTLAGLAMGTAVALAAEPWLEDVLFAVSAADPTVFVTVVLALGTTGAIASLVPAWRAASVDPTRAFREE